MSVPLSHRWLILRIAVALGLIALATAVLLAMPAADGTHRLADVASLGMAYWTVVLGGAIGLSFALWIHAAAPRQWGTRCYLVAGIGFAVSAWATSARVLWPVAPAFIRTALSTTAVAALLLFMGGFVVMFLRFPQALVSQRAARLIVAIGAAAGLAAAVPVVRQRVPLFELLFFGAIIAVVVLILVQAWLGRRDARIRLRLGIIAATVVLGAVLYILVNLFWPRAGEAPERAEVLFPLNTMIFMGMGLTTAPATIFAKGGWGRSVMLSALLATAAMLLDALLLAFATRQQGAALQLPAFQSLSPLICRQADHGRRLFADEDIVTVKSLVRILDQLIAGRDAYLRGVEVERDRIARDLHDDVNGRLVTSLLRDDHAAMRDDVRGAISEIRTIVRAADGSNRSLANLLADLRHETATRLEAVGIALDWPAGSCPEDPVIDYLAYRHVASILRECVTNVIRHAEATRVRIDAHVDADGFEINIADDGRGAGPVPNAGNGLVNCRRRAELIGGTFHIEPRASGFAQQLVVPVAGRAPAPFPPAGGPQVANSEADALPGGGAANAPI